MINWTLDPSAEGWVGAEPGPPGPNHSKFVWEGTVLRPQEPILVCKGGRGHCQAPRSSPGGRPLECNSGHRDSDEPQGVLLALGTGRMQLDPAHELAPLHSSDLQGQNVECQ